MACASSNGIGIFTIVDFFRCFHFSRVATKAEATGPFRTAAKLFAVQGAFGHTTVKFCEQIKFNSTGQAAIRQGPRERRTALNTTFGWLQGRSQALRLLDSFLSQRKTSLAGS